MQWRKAELLGSYEDDVAAIARLDMVPSLLDTICRLSGMGFAAIARVTDDRWIACSVRDEINFGLEAGGELNLETTICHEVRQNNQAVVIPDVDADPIYAKHHTPALYGLKSYISVPITLPDGRFFGTLCAIDPNPHDLDKPGLREMFDMFASLVALQLDQADRISRHLMDNDAMRASEIRHRQILDSATDYAIIATDRNGRVTRWNEGASRILGWTEEEMLGEGADRLFTAEDRSCNRLKAEMHAARVTGRGPDERWHLNKGGERFWASGSITPLRTPSGELDGYVKVLRDETNERRREQRLALLGEVAAGLLEATDPDQVLGPILEQGSELLGFDESYSYVLTPDCKNLHLTHSVGASEEVRATLVSASFDLPICGIVAQTRKPVVIDNLHISLTQRARSELSAGRSTSDK